MVVPEHHMSRLVMRSALFSRAVKTPLQLSAEPLCGSVSGATLRLRSYTCTTKLSTAHDTAVAMKVTPIAWPIVRLTLDAGGVAVTYVVYVETEGRTVAL